MPGAPENEYISDNPDWLVPKKSDKKVTFDLSGGVSRNKIKEEIGYDIGFDVTTLDAYDAAVQAKWLSSEEDDFDSLRERNYINEVSPIFFPLGIAEGDWIAVENYNMTEIIGCFVTRNYFLTRMFLIKDGEIIREFEPLSLGDNFVNNVVFSFGELYVNCTDRLMGIDLQTGEMQLLTDDNGYITAINKDYIIFEHYGEPKIWIRETSEVIHPDICWSRFGRDFRLVGDRIEYKEDGIPKVYDIKSRTLTEDRSLVFADEYAQRNNDKWSVCFETADDDIYETECLPAVRAINIADVSERVYDLKALNSELTGDIIYNWGTLMLDGDILWIEICDYFTGVLNLATGEAAEAERRFYEMKYISDGVMKITDETDVGYTDGDYIYYIAEVNYPV